MEHQITRPAGAGVRGRACTSSGGRPGREPATCSDRVRIHEEDRMDTDWSASGAPGAQGGGRSGRDDHPGLAAQPQRAVRRLLARAARPRSTGARPTTASGSSCSPATGPVFCSGADLKEHGSSRATPRAGDRVVPGDHEPDLGEPQAGRLPAERHRPRRRAGPGGRVRLRDRAGHGDVRVHRGPARRGPRDDLGDLLRRLDPRAAAEYFLTGEVFDAAARAGDRPAHPGRARRGAGRRRSPTTPACCCAAARRRSPSPSGCVRTVPALDSRRACAR